MGKAIVFSLPKSKNPMTYLVARVAQNVLCQAGGAESSRLEVSFEGALRICKSPAGERSSATL
jgi:hypothetical protein